MDVSYSSLPAMLEPLTPVKQTGDTHFPLNKGLSSTHLEIGW